MWWFYPPCFAGSLKKFDLKARPQLFDFILEILSNPCFSSIMTWEGVHGQFVVKRPDTVAWLWSNRNGRRNMTYQKFCRALRYYHQKNVLTKIRGRKFTYKFNFRELERQYGFKSIPFPATSAYSDTPSCAIPATGVHATDIFPVTEVHTCDMFPTTGVHTTFVFPAIPTTLFPPLLSVPVLSW